jgi:hypothetical protein
LTPRTSARPTVSSDAQLELPGVELRGIGVRRALLELDQETVLLVELLRLDHRRQECAQRRRAEYDDG